MSPKKKLTSQGADGNKHILALGNDSRTVYRDFLKGLLEYSRIHQRNWVLYVNSPHYRPLNLKDVTIDNIRHWKIHGIIDYLLSPTKTAKLMSTGLPYITIGGTQKEATGNYIVTVDNFKMGQMGAKHFLDKKFSDLAYYGIRNVFWSQKRGDAFTNTATEAGVRFHIYEQPYLEDAFSWENEMPNLTKWLKTLPKPIGLMAYSDKMAQRVIEACHVAKLHVPEEVAVLGNGNDDFFCRLSTPSLSSIALDTENIGYRTGEVLDQLMDGKKLPPQKLVSEPTAIIERQSSNVLAIKDDIVKQAVQFIRLNCMKQISVNDVANAACTTIRTLERRFKKSLGRSVHNEVTRMRIEQACYMLVTTNLSISEIALKLGYSELKYLSRAFKREKGVGPLAYRRTATTICP